MHLEGELDLSTRITLATGTCSSPSGQQQDVRRNRVVAFRYKGEFSECEEKKKLWERGTLE